MLVLRFSNGWFEPLWNRNFIDYVEITGAESIGVEERGGYYDGSGAMRDMFQNHLLQVLAMVAMEPPAIINANSMRDEVAKVMHSLRPLTSEDMENNLVLGQYTAAEINGKMEKGYLEEKKVCLQILVLKPTSHCVVKLKTGVGLACRSMFVRVNAYQLV